MFRQVRTSNVPLCSEWDSTCNSPCKSANAPSSLPCSAWLCVAAAAAAACRTDIKALTFPEHMSTGVYQCDLMNPVMFRVGEGAGGETPIIKIEDLTISYCDLYFLVVIAVLPVQ